MSCVGFDEQLVVKPAAHERNGYITPGSFAQSLARLIHVFSVLLTARIAVLCSCNKSNCVSQSFGVHLPNGIANVRMPVSHPYIDRQRSTQRCEALS
jgi:hypothetical protein